MKNLVKLFIVFVLFTMTSELFAQNVGVRAGLNLSTMQAKDDDENYSKDYSMNPGFNFGITAEIPLSEIFSIETGMLLSTKGYYLEDEISIFGATVDYEEVLNLLYLDIPITAKASFDVGGVKIYGLFGPYIGYGISGKLKVEASAAGETESEEIDVEWGNDEEEDLLKRLDYGLIMGLGVEIQSFQIGINYNLGLANIVSNTDNGLTANNRVLALSVTYWFGK